MRMTKQWFDAYAEARRREGLKGPPSIIKASLYFDCGDTAEAAAGQDRADAEAPISE